jgi:hypothetical protein
VRVRSKIIDGLAERGWTVASEYRDVVRRALPQSFAMDGAGRVVKRV